MSLVTVIVFAVVVGGASARTRTADSFAAASADLTQAVDQTPLSDLESAVAGAEGALAVGSDLASADVTAAYTEAHDEAAATLTAATGALQAAQAAASASASESTTDDLLARLDEFRTAAADAQEQFDALVAVREQFTADVIAGGEAVLGDYADAEKSTEDALHTALQEVEGATGAPLGDAVAQATQAAAAVRSSAKDYRAEIAAQASGQPTGGDVDAQIDYLLEYATDYNTAEWGDYNSSGGDCVNFTSQGLLARGWQMDGTWSSTGPGGASKAWILTPTMDEYLQSLGFVSHDQDDLDRVRVGDVGIFDWGENGWGRDHTMTVSKIEYTTEGPVIYFASHNSDGQYRELMTALYEEHSDSTVKIYSIP
ncbi:hypothetical protein GCM10025738_15110 [Microbacterium fluvii]